MLISSTFHQDEANLPTTFVPGFRVCSAFLGNAGDRIVTLPQRPRFEWQSIEQRVRSGWPDARAIGVSRPVGTSRSSHPLGRPIPGVSGPRNGSPVISRQICCCSGVSNCMICARAARQRSSKTILCSRGESRRSSRSVGGRKVSASMARILDR